MIAWRRPRGSEESVGTRGLTCAPTTNMERKLKKITSGRKFRQKEVEITVVEPGHWSPGWNLTSFNYVSLLN